MNEQNKGKKKKVFKNPKEKKAAKIVALTVVLATLLLLLLNFLSECDFSSLSSNKDNGNSDETSSVHYKFYFPDYDEDIMQSDEYLSMNRLITYTVGNQSTMIPEDKYDGYDEFVNFLHDYFSLIIAGNCEEYNKCFADSYFEQKGVTKKTEFTMQRIYDIELSYYGMQVENEGKATQKTYAYYKTEYKIQKNNGTFRNDMGSDCSKAEVYTLCSDDATGKIQIVSIVKENEFEGFTN